MVPASDLDDCVRDALDPGPGAVDRMVATAVRRGREPRRRPVTVLRLAMAGAGVLAGVLYFAWPGTAPPNPPDEFVLTRAGDVVLIQSASGEAWILSSPVVPDPAKVGTGYVIVEGGNE